MTAATMDCGSTETEEVGVVLVHGIGEQRRFEHLDSQLRYLIQALQDLKQTLNINEHFQVDELSVDIVSSGGAAFHAEQDSWNAGPEPSVVITVKHQLHGEPRKVRLNVHEVWWADVNERYSLAKQIRFWLWGLAMWAHPGRRSAQGATSGGVKTLKPKLRLSRWARGRLFLVGFFFVLLGYSIGTISFLVTRLFQLETPDLLKTLSNYVSGVKLYNQVARQAPNLLGAREDFLDTVHEPPRVSIRRRMIRSLADVAHRNYGRWYVLAHSLGTVVAFNGLMAPGYIWPGYLDEARWRRLKDAEHENPSRKFVISATLEEIDAARDVAIYPHRPVWIEAHEKIDRSVIFKNLAGILTYGSPLEKFAHIWPGLVPISNKPDLPLAVRWINLYDPIDPVSGRLESFSHEPASQCPNPIELGYNAGWILLLAHLKYLERSSRPADAASAVVHWLLTGCAGGFPRPEAAGLVVQPKCAAPTPILGWRSGEWIIKPRSARPRTAIAWLSWAMAAIVLVLLGTLTVPVFLETVGAALRGIGHVVAAHAPGLGAIGSILTGLANRVDGAGAAFPHGLSGMFWLAIGAAGLTLLAGVGARWLVFASDETPEPEGADAND